MRRTSGNIRAMSISPIPIIHGCWADLFALSQFRAPRRRFYGPGTWDGVRAREPDWGWPFDSVIVGPGAYVQVYRGVDFAGTVEWFLPGERVADLLDYVRDDVDSLRLFDDAPGPTDPGYESYARATARLRPRGHRR